MRVSSLVRVPLARATARIHSAARVMSSPSGKATRYCPSDRLKGFDAPTVWQEFTPLAITTKAVNLGQGFPDWPCPEFLKVAAARAIANNNNQYARSGGHPALVEALAKRYSTALDRALDPMTEVTVTVGASEALFSVMQSFVNPGDEVLALEPTFDIYLAQVKMAGGVCKTVPLRRSAPGAASAWYLDVAELEAAITPRTRVLVLNTPHNPTGKMLTREELEGVAAVVKRHPDLIVVTDEVYEHITYDGRVHQRIASLPDMFERTLTVSSAGKTFSCTGWKIGWVVGPQHLIKPVMLTNQWVQFSVCTPLQVAVAEALDEADKPYEGFPTYYDWLRATYHAKRRMLCDALRTAGIAPLLPEGGIFAMGDTGRLEVPDKYLAETTEAAPVMTRDWALCRYLAMEHGVVAIPPSAFYCHERKHEAAEFARFAICKTDESLQQAALRFATMGAKLGTALPADTDSAAAAAPAPKDA